MGVESGGNPNALSPQGASGRMQIMPGTFKQYARPGESFDNDEHRTNAALRKLHDDFQWAGGDLQKTAAAYIGGRGAVRPDGTIRDDVKDAHGTTPVAYVQKVMSRLRPAGAQAPQQTANAGADIGVAEDGRLYVNGQVFDSKDYGRAIELARGGAFTSPGRGSLPPGFRQPQPGEVETYFETIVPRSDTGKSFKAGIENFKGGWNEILGMAQQALGRSPEQNTGIAAADRNKRYAGQLGALNQLPQDWDSAQGVGGVAQLTWGKVVESAPYMAELIGPGLFGAMVKSVALKGARVAAGEAMAAATEAALAKGLAPAAARAAGEKVAEETLSLATRYAPQIAMMAGGYPSAVGDIAGNMRDQNPDAGYNIPAAMGLGVPYSALNLIGGGAQAVNLLSGGALRGAAGAEMRGLGGRALRGASAALWTGAEEAVGETGQEMLNQAGRVSVDPSASMTSPEALKRYRESAIVGGLVGAAMGGVGGAVSSARPVNMLAPTTPPEQAPPDQYVRGSAPAGTLDPFSRTLGAQSGITGAAAPNYTLDPSGVNLTADQIASGSLTGEVPSPEAQVVGRPSAGTSSITGPAGFSLTSSIPPQWMDNAGSRGASADSVSTDATMPLERARYIASENPSGIGAMATNPNAGTSTLTGTADPRISMLAPREGAKNPPRGKGAGSRVKSIDATAPEIAPVKSATPQETLGEPGRNATRVTKDESVKGKYRSPYKVKLESGAIEGGATLDTSKAAPVATTVAKPEAAPKAEAEAEVTDEVLTDEEIKESEEMIKLFAGTNKKRAAPKKATKEEDAKARADAKALSKLSEELMNDGELTENLNTFDTLTRNILGPSRQVSQAAKYKDTRRTRVPTTPSANKDTEASTRNRAAALVAIVDRLETLVEKHGTAKVDAMFAYRKKNKLETAKDLEDEGEAQSQTAANIRLSNLWRLYRDGNLNDSPFGFTRPGEGTGAGGRTTLEKGGKLKTLEDWFKGKHPMLNGKYRGTKKNISGVAALAYMMRHQPRNDLEGMLGGVLYHLFKNDKLSDNIDFLVVEGDHVDGAAGLFVVASKEKPQTITSSTGEKVVLTKPTVVLSQSGANEETLVHELLHAATAHVTNNDAKARAKFVPIIDAIKKHVDEEGTPKNKEGKYDQWLRDVLQIITGDNEKTAVAELVAYGFTDSRFQDFLKTVKVARPPEGVVAAKLRNAFEYFVNMVKLVVGAHGVKYSALHRLIEEGARLLETAEATPMDYGKPAKFAQALSSADTLVPYTALTKPGNFVETAYRKTLETLLPFMYGQNADGTTKFEALITKLGKKIEGSLIDNMPGLAYQVAGVVDKFGVPDVGKQLLDMGRRLAHNAGEQSMTLWGSLKALPEDQQKLVHDYISSGGKLDVSALPKQAQADVKNFEVTLKDVMSRAVDQGVLPETMRGVPITDFIQWINSKSKLAYGLKAGSNFEQRAKLAGEYVKKIHKGHVVGPGPTYKTGVVTAVDSNGEPASYRVYVSSEMSAAAASKEHGNTIVLDPDGKVFRKMKTGKTMVHMWRPYTHAEGMKQMRGSSYIDALTYTMHHVLHDTGANEFAESMVEGMPLNSKDGLVYDDVDKLAKDVGKGRIMEKPKTPKEKQYARTPGYWTKLGEGYGSLSGKYVPGPVYAAITDMHSQEVLFPNYDRVLSFWKTMKTGLNPVTHFNNVASSFVMAYANDIPLSTIKGAFQMTYDATFSKKKSALWNEIENAGAFVSGHNAHEFSATIYGALNRAVLEDHGSDTSAGLLGFMQKWEQAKAAIIAKHAANYVGGKAKLMLELYGFEDNVFRAAGYMEFVRREMGKSDGLRGDAMKHAAGKFAADSMVNYSIDARYINNLRKTVMPFLAWPYRMVPMIIRTALFKPWKIMTIMTALYGINALAYAVTGGDEDDERKKLPEYMRGNMWLMGGAPKAIRMPVDKDGKPVFWDVSSFMPLGDFLSESRQGFLGMPWPAGLLPGGPLIIGAELLLGYNMFQDKKISAPTADASERVGDRMKYAWNAFSPGIPLPLNTKGDKVADLLREKHGITGGEMEWGLDVLGMVGPKIVALDGNERNAQMGIATAAIVRDYRAAVAKLARDEARYANPKDVSEKQAELIADMLEKIKKLKGESE